MDTLSYLTDDSVQNLLQRLEMQKAYIKTLKKCADSAGRLYNYEIIYDTKNIPSCKGACYLLDTDVKNKEKSVFFYVNVKSLKTKEKLTAISVGAVSRETGKGTININMDLRTEFMGLLKIICIPYNTKIEAENKSNNKTNIIIKGLSEKNKYAKILNEHTYKAISFYLNECNKEAKKDKPLFRSNIYIYKGYNKKITKEDLVLEMNTENFGKDSLQLNYINKQGNKIMDNYFIRVAKKDLEEGDYSELFFKNYSKTTGMKSILR